MFRKLVAPVILLAAGFLAAGEPKFSEDQIRDFLRSAKVVGSRQISKGITRPWQLTMKHGEVTHDAHFQAIDERKDRMQFGTGRTELNFRDSYHFNIAAYELARLLGLSDMIPVAVASRWKGQSGALAWWIPKKMDEGDRLKQKVQPPDAEAWNRQIHKMRVFNQLVYDTDPNLGNWVITEDWKLWRVDFTRAFRLFPDLQNKKDLARCDRQLLEKLRQLDAAEVVQKTRPHLNKSEVEAIMTRRDKILTHFQQLVSERGESEVLY